MPSPTGSQAEGFAVQQTMLLWLVDSWCSTAVHATFPRPLKLLVVIQKG